MNLYKEMLDKEGFAKTNVCRLASAFDLLHSAIAKLDKDQLDLLMSKSLQERLKDFATIEQLYVFHFDSIENIKKS